MKDIIFEKLKQIEIDNNVTILFAIESGSRAWGFSSKDSDYDVRFVYKHNPDWYLTIEEERDVIELPVDEVLDISGWDIRKALRLSAKSNFVIWEWLQSPIVYIEKEGFRDEMLNAIGSRFSPISAAHSYLSLATRTIDEHYNGTSIKIKKYFYILRALLSAYWIVEKQTVPPMQFKHTLSLFENKTEFIKAIESLLKVKESSTEKDMCDRIPEIDSIIDSTLLHINEHIKNLPKAQDTLEKINTFYRKTVAE